MDYLNYALSPNSYGTIHVFPLALANHALTDLEEWFVNLKLIYFLESHYSDEEFEKYRLPIEFTYGRRIRNRNASQVKESVSEVFRQAVFQELYRILILQLERSYEIKLALDSKKEGQTVADLEVLNRQKSLKYNRSGMLDKIKKFEVDEKFTPYLEMLESINKARNCFEHRNGIVSDKDCNQGNWLVIKYEFPTADPDNDSIFKSLPKETNTRVQFVGRSLKFRKGQKISLNLDESYRLVYGISICIKGIIDGMYEELNFEEQCPIIKEFK